MTTLRESRGAFDQQFKSRLRLFIIELLEIRLDSREVSILINFDDFENIGAWTSFDFWNATDWNEKSKRRKCLRIKCARLRKSNWY